MIPLTAIALISVGLFSCLDAILGYLTNILGIPVYQSICVRMTFVFVLALGYVIGTGTPDAPFGPRDVRRFMWMRGILISIGLTTGYSSLRYLTISEFLTVFYCLPFPTGFLCWILLGERFTRIQIICCCFSMLGVVMITDPFNRWTADTPTDHEPSPILHRAIDDHIPDDLMSKLKGLAICTPSVLTLAGELTIMRIIKDQASTMQILVIVSFCPAVISGLILAGTRTPIVFPETWLGWVLLFSIGPVGLGAQYSLTYASKGLPGVHGTICRYAGIIFSSALQWLIYGNHPSIMATVGMAVICVAGLCSTVYAPSSEVGKDEQTDLEDRSDIEMPLMGESQDR